ncbi:MBL fold hydrolase [Marivivens niveibacter]|uniref:MBL fold hydrolase n=1 Tax=Marivivens niveibacter TaxID=1930667 RepID=A0A251X003_9RHOB|nr:MBL fold metallo-hydrolase [Marivivens niveibacter]OUD10070.1 MBL fold hydrolase [Marivivens niveibacter]
MMDGEQQTIRYPIEIASGVFWLRLPLPMALDHVNIYALDDGDSWTLIDAGIGTRKCRAALDAVLNGPLAGKPVGRVVLTHHHPDHVGLAGELCAKGAALVTTRTTYILTRMLTLDVQEKYTDHALEFYRRYGMNADVLTARSTDERPFNFADCVGDLPAGYLRIKDGDTIQMGGRTWDVITGDGHAPEHATFWSRDDNLVLGGDQLLPSISPNIGVYPTEPESDPLGEWIASCEKFLPLARDDQLVLGGHKLPYFGLPLRLRQLIENHHGALDRLLDHLETPRRGGECFVPLFKRDISGGEYGLAFVETVAHLNYLFHRGHITRQMGDDGAWLWQRA